MIKENVVIDIDSGVVERLNQNKKFPKFRSQSDATKQKFVSYLLTGITQNFSFNGNMDFDVDMLEIFYKFTNSTKKDIEFVADTLIQTRHKALMVEPTILCLIALSTSYNKFGKQKFREIFNDVILTGDDLILFLNFINSRIIRGFGKSIQHAATEWLLNAPTSEIIKLKFNSNANNNIVYSINGRRRTTFNIRDIIRLLHIRNFKNEKQATLFAWLINKDIEGKDCPDQVVAYERFAKLNKIQILAGNSHEIIKNNNIPIDVLRATKAITNIPTPYFKDIFMNATFHEIVDNIDLFYKKGVFKDEVALNKMLSIFSNKETIFNSGLTPVKLMNMADAVSGNCMQLSMILSKAAEYALDKFDDISKNIIIAVDQNNSMEVMTQDSLTTVRMAVNSLAASIAKKATKATILPFSSKIVEIDVNKEDNITKIANDINNSNCGRIRESTSNSNFESLFTHIKEKNYRADAFVFITHAIEWNNILRSSSTANRAISEYLSTYEQNSFPRILFMTTGVMRDDAYRHQVGNTTLVYGFNETILKYVLTNLSDSHIVI